MPCARLVALTAAVLAAIAPIASTAQKHTAPRSIGLVLTNFWYAMEESRDGKTECPAGMNAETLAQFRAQFPTAEAQKAQFVHAMDFQARGPRGENTAYNPDLAGPAP
jgi:hypothetical protein